jgi:hypothetical protein
VKDALSLWGRKVGEASRKAEDLSRNTWQHREYFFTSSPNISTDHQNIHVLKFTM